MSRVGFTIVASGGCRHAVARDGRALGRIALVTRGRGRERRL